MNKKTGVFSLLLLFACSLGHAGFMCPTDPSVPCCDGPWEPGCGPSGPKPAVRPTYPVVGAGWATVDTHDCGESERSQALAQSRAKAQTEAGGQCPAGWVEVSGDWRDKVNCVYALNGSRFGTWTSESSAEFLCHDSPR